MNTARYYRDLAYSTGIQNLLALMEKNIRSYASQGYLSHTFYFGSWPQLKYHSSVVSEALRDLGFRVICNLDSIEVIWNNANQSYPHQYNKR